MRPSVEQQPRHLEMSVLGRHVEGGNPGLYIINYSTQHPTIRGQAEDILSIGVFL